MLYVYAITESGTYTVTRTKLLIKYRATLYWHEIKGKKQCLFPPPAQTLISLTWTAFQSWNMNRLRSHDWTGEGSSQLGQVPLIEPLLNLTGLPWLGP